MSDDLLRNIAPRLRSLLEEYNSEETTDERRLELEEEMLHANTLIEDKADALADYADYWDNKANIKKIEEERLCTLRERDERKAERLRKYLAAILSTAGKDKFQTNFHGYWFSKSARVEVRDSTLIPTGFLRVIPSKSEPDKVLIKKALGQGRDVPGCALVHDRHLQIQ